MGDEFKQYFLDAVDSSDLFFRTPHRLKSSVEPLIDRALAFQAMERDVLAATESVLLAGWVFLPDTPLLDPGVQKATRGRTWLDLIHHVVTKDPAVFVRILVTDFDPFFEPRNHRLCWSALSALSLLRDRLPESRRARLEYMGSLHRYFITPSLVTLGSFSTEDQIKALVAEYNAMGSRKARSLFSRTPGHWGSIDGTGKKFVVGAAPEERAFIASHHQKFCVVDGRIAFCGGMDLTPLALDTPDHRPRRHPFKRKQFDLFWHDVQARIEGAVVEDIERNFCTRWNDEHVESFVRWAQYHASAPAGASLPIMIPTAMIPTKRPAARAGGSVVQALRTVSVNKDAQLLPDLKRSDVLEAYSGAIAAAKQYLYIENQYFRSSELTDQIIARHKQIPNLQVILVIPIAPEELTSAKSADPKALHPIAVQIEQIDRLKAALGRNFGVFSLIARVASVRKSFTDAFGSPQIYVHSKLIIVDDEYATIGSANINGRSFRMDTELNVGWFDRSAVRKFRLQSWKHLLGSHAVDMLSWSASSFAERWNAAAILNSKEPAATRSGLVIPHDNGLLRAVAKKRPWVPDVFIDIEDVLPEAAVSDLVERDEARDDPEAAIG